MEPTAPGPMAYLSIHDGLIDQSLGQSDVAPRVSLGRSDTPPGAELMPACVPPFRSGSAPCALVRASSIPTATSLVREHLT